LISLKVGFCKAAEIGDPHSLHAVVAVVMGKEDQLSWRLARAPHGAQDVGLA
jgi:hypothetical protein